MMLAFGLSDAWRYLTEYRVLGNRLGAYVLLFLALLLALVVGRILCFVLSRIGERLKGRERTRFLGLFLICLGKPLMVVMVGGGLKLGLLPLHMTEHMRNAAGSVTHVVVSIGIAYFIYKLVDIVEFYLSRWAARSDTKLDDMLVPLVRKSLRITIVIIVSLFIVQNVSGQNITTLLAGLGVGGLAVALAAQDTIKNFFGSIMILLDKPFGAGDRVVIDGHDGPVEEVGFRSTKIRTLDGHLVTIPNEKVAGDIVQNIGARPYIRRLTNITITYDTPPEKADRALKIIREILDNHEGMDPEFPPRVFFNEFNSDSLNILMIYWYHPPDYWAYLAFSERVNLELLRRFNEEGIEFAFPTQTIYLANDDRRQLALRLLREGMDVTGPSGGDASAGGNAES